MTTRGRSLSLTLFGDSSRVVSLANNVLTLRQRLTMGHSEDAGFSREKVNLALQNHYNRRVAGMDEAAKSPT